METFDVFDADHFGLDGQILVIYAGGKPRLGLPEIHTRPLVT